MSIKDVLGLIEQILQNNEINWILTAIIITVIIFVAVAIVILSKFNKIRNSIKENSIGFCQWLKGVKKWKKILLGILIVGCVVIIFGGSYKIKKVQRYQEIVITTEDDEEIYPLGVDILEKKEVGDITFFTYNMIDSGTNTNYPVLYKWEKGKMAERISEGACSHFEVVKDSIVYLDSTLMDQSHGYLHVVRPDGENQRLLEKEVYNFAVDGEYIYYIYCYDTVGTGLDGHALHRMDLNGSNIVTAAYELSSPLLVGDHFDFYIKDGWAIYSNYKVQIGNPADGLEKVVLLEPINEEWIYYTSNRLIKAKPDGSEQMVLDDIDESWYQIDTEGKNKITLN